MSCAAPMAGGRKRRGGKTMKGGNFYGFTGALDGTTAGAGWGAVENNAVDPVTGATKLDYAMPGGRRRGRKGKKATRKGKKSRRSLYRRRRTMRGGASYVGSANAGYSYAGTGSAGLADAAGYRANVPGGAAGHTQVNGVWSA
jgi:hypothetical protein